MAAWRGFNGFPGRAGLRAWLARGKGARRPDEPRPGGSGNGDPSAGRPEVPLPEPLGTADTPWLEPYPDDLLDALAGNAQVPDARYEARESISLVFVAALQHLPPRERAALVLCDVLGFRAAEAAEILDCTPEAVRSTLSGARSELVARLPPGWSDRSPLPYSARECEVTGRFAAAVEGGDVDGIVALLAEDAWLTMPPLPFGYRGRAAAEFLAAVPRRSAGHRLRLVATRANGQPAFGCYLGDPVAAISRAHGLIVLTLDGDRVSGITRFIDNGVLTRFGLPRTLPD